LNDITDFIYNKLKDYNLENTFKIQSYNNTLQVEITTIRESVYFNKERSFTKTYRSDQTVNILKINTIRLEYNIISGSYVDNTPNHTLHEFCINVPPGYKVTVTPHHLIYLPINCDEISTLSTRIVHQSADLVNLRGENFSTRMHIRLIELFTSKGRLISGGSVEWQFYPDVYISRARTAVRSPSPSLP